MSILDRMVSAVEKVSARLLRVSRALEKSAIDYAVIGGNAVAAWVASVDESAVRNTQDVDILLEREQLPSAIQALEAEGFLFRHVEGVDLFLDGPGARARDAVHVLFANEKVRPEYPEPTPGLTEALSMGDFRLLSLSALVRMKLTFYRDKDRMHLRDLIEVGLVDPSWPSQLPLELGRRLQALLDDPHG